MRRTCCYCLRMFHNTGKFLSLLILILLVCAMGCSCADASERNRLDSNATDKALFQTKNGKVSVIALDINDGIFNLSSCVPGFAQTIGTNGFAYQLKDIHLNLRIYDKTVPIESIQPGNLDSFDKRTENGTDYYIRTESICWDGIDEETGEAIGGTTTTTDILFNIDEYVVSLSGSTENGDTSAVTFKLALDMLSKAPTEGVKQISSDYLFARLWNGSMECNISFIPKDNAEYQNTLNMEETVSQEENGIRYLASISERSPDDPNVRFIICNTDKGALLISCGVPYSERNNVPAEELDFINFSLAQDIAEHLGVMITSII